MKEGVKNKFEKKTERQGCQLKFREKGKNR